MTDSFTPMMGEAPALADTIDVIARVKLMLRATKRTFIFVLGFRALAHGADDDHSQSGERQ